MIVRLRGQVDGAALAALLQQHPGLIVVIVATHARVAEVERLCHGRLRRQLGLEVISAAELTPWMDVVLRRGLPVYTPDPRRLVVAGQPPRELGQVDHDVSDLDELTVLLGAQEEPVEAMDGA